ncbi:hypothetical protein [Psychroserpens sp.]|uniref:hypothetical protein n=2 Tax=Psychroserpens sp. TaxID=2020870 RepID=UPI003CC5128F
MAAGYRMSKREHILKNEAEIIYEDINDVMELYNIKKFIDKELYLKSWTSNEIINFKKKAIRFGSIVGQFMAKLNDNNVCFYYEKLIYGYVNSFWELVNNYKLFSVISHESIESILKINPYEIRSFLSNKKLVDKYNNATREFLLSYSKTAEILLSIYEAENNNHNKKREYLPKSLTINDKENIISKYIDNEDCNLNYLRLIKIARNRNDFKISDKTRLKAKRKEKLETEKILNQKKGFSGQKFGISVGFSKNQKTIKEGNIKDLTTNYSYSFNYIKENSDSHSLFLNFIILFEYLDNQNRIELVSKKSEFGVLERIMGIRSQNEYKRGISFDMKNMTSYVHIAAYYRLLTGLEKSLETILQNVFTSVFKEKYNFASNARISIPSDNISSFEKVRFIAPEFESVLKQFKLFVEEREIDFELLQMTSKPSNINDIPSLIPNKYIYFKNDNEDLVNCSSLFFSDQTMLAYIEPFKEKHYRNFFDLLANEEVCFDNYEEYQKPQLNYLIDKGFLFLDKKNNIQFSNIPRVFILKDLFENEFSSFYHFPKEYQEEAIKMEKNNIIYFESTLLSKPEQSYFNFHLNKKEFTNGMDLRNSYLHGTQANPEEISRHEYSYLTYLKLLTLIILKINDDLHLSYIIKNKGQTANVYSS